MEGRPAVRAATSGNAAPVQRRFYYAAFLNSRNACLISKLVKPGLGEGIFELRIVEPFVMKISHLNLGDAVPVYFSLRRGDVCFLLRTSRPLELHVSLC